MTCLISWTEQTSSLAWISGQATIKYGSKKETSTRLLLGRSSVTINSGFLPFGLCNAPATFQRLMNDVFRRHINWFVLVYLDDLLVYSRNPEEHLAHLRAVLTLFRQHKLFIKRSKCTFAMTSINFLGHVISDEEIGRAHV